ITFLAEVRNFGPQTVSGRQAEFFVDGARAGDASVDVESGGAAAVSFTHRFEDAGEHTVEVRLADDPLLVDNHRWLSMPVRESIRVLCIRGKPGAAEHVAYALSPSQSDRPRVRPEVVVESLLLELDLSQYDAIFLCNVGRFGRDEANVLRQYLAGGGGLVTFLGDQVQSENYNEMLGGESSEERVLPAKLGEAAFSQSPISIDPLRYVHPIVRPFEGHPQSGLITTPIWKYIRLAPYDPQQVRTAAALTGGDALIVEETIGRGRSILVATAPSNESIHRGPEGTTPWTTMALWPSFPPLVQEMLALAVSGRNENRNVMVGDELSATAPPSAGQSLTLIGPGDHRERIVTSMEEGRRRWSFANVDLSGLYHANYDSTRAAQVFAANVDPRESDLTRIDPETLPSQFSQTIEAAAEETPVAALARPRQEWFRWFLGAVLLLMLTETCFAWWIGNRAAR
ncbi:MAG: hypothetical protein KY475_21985, partial [Planctomycetes bacterium]|nr:hypothetical protein [Planctomycetota bacterium]